MLHCILLHVHFYEKVTYVFRKKSRIDNLYQYMYESYTHTHVY